MARYFAPTLAPLVHEELWIAALNNTDRVRGIRRVSSGGLHSVRAGSADILRSALEMAAVSFMLVHNHPSGDPRPTSDGDETARDLRCLSHAMNIPLQLHVIVTSSGRDSSVLE